MKVVTLGQREHLAIGVVALIHHVVAKLGHRPRNDVEVVLLAKFADLLSEVALAELAATGGVRAAHFKAAPVAFLGCELLFVLDFKLLDGGFVSAATI